MGTKAAFGPSKQGSADKPLFGAEENRFPVFSGSSNPQYQSRKGK
jgi:hypothetical protein